MRGYISKEEFTPRVDRLRQRMSLLSAQLAQRRPLTCSEWWAGWRGLPKRGAICLSAMDGGVIWR